MEQLRLYPGVHSNSEVSLPSMISTEELDWNIAESTFVGGLEEPAHRWYKLRPSFSPFLVRYLYSKLATSDTNGLFDPFAGAGTALIEAKRIGVNSWGIEINPFLATFTKFSLDWSAGPKEIDNEVHRLARQLHQAITSVEALDLYAALNLLKTQRPPIHNPLRWWREEVLKNLLAAKQILLKQDPKSLAYRLMWLTVGTSCIEVANIKRLHPTLTFFDRSKEDIDVENILLEKLEEIAKDLVELHRIHIASPASATILQGDSLKASSLIRLKQSVVVITSPPYPNRYSYVWETRPHLFLMDLIKTGKEASDLDLAAPGGTWGTATSVLLKGIITPRQEYLSHLLKPIVSQLRKHDNLMANYVVKYFNMMDQHLDELGRVLPPGSRFAYVVGNSRIKGIDIPRETILANQIEAKRWGKVDRLIIFRKRIGRRALFETAIVGTRMGKKTTR